MLMCPDNGAVDHHVFVVMIDRQMTKNPFDDTAFTPAAQTPVDVLPVTKPGRKVTPWNPRAIAIQHGFHEQTVVRSRATNMTFTTGEKVLYPFPLIIA